MRVKDELKQDALFKATIKLVNEIGFVASSVSKIAREADVSPATIYVYYKNKEDLLVSTYINIKQTLSDEILRDFCINTLNDCDTVVSVVVDIVAHDINIITSRDIHSTAYIFISPIVIDFIVNNGCIMCAKKAYSMF